MPPNRSAFSEWRIKARSCCPCWLSAFAMRLPLAPAAPVIKSIDVLLRSGRQSRRLTADKTLARAERIRRGPEILVNPSSLHFLLHDYLQKSYYRGEPGARSTISASSAA